MPDNNQPPGNNNWLPEPDPLSPDELAAAYAKAKAEFSAADLQRFTEEDEGIPFENILAQLEEMDRLDNEKQE